MADYEKYQKAFRKAHERIAGALKKAAPPKIVPGPNQQRAAQLLEQPQALQGLLVARRSFWLAQGVAPEHADLMAKQEINQFMERYHSRPQREGEE